MVITYDEMKVLQEKYYEELHLVQAKIAVIGEMIKIAEEKAAVKLQEPVLEPVVLDSVDEIA